MVSPKPGIPEFCLFMSEISPLPGGPRVEEMVEEGLVGAKGVAGAPSL